MITNSIKGHVVGMKTLRWIPAALLLVTFSRASAQTVVIDKIDKNHSTIGFSVPIMGGLSEVEGKFTDFNVVMNYDTIDVTKSSVTATIEMKSVDTGIEARDNDLRSPRFFDVAQFPQMVFTSNKISRRGNGYVASGTLTMHGITKAMDLPFTIRTAPEADGKTISMAVLSDLMVDRDDWGVSWRHPKNMFVSNEVTLKLRVLTRPVAVPAPR
jgi:polyisoprenoid-binding protein YceI